MRRRSWMLGVLAVALPLHAHAFEGVLHMMMSMPSVAPVKTDVTIRYNGDACTDTFIPFLNQRVSFIQRGSAPVLQMMHSTKQYTESSYLRNKAAGDAAAALQGLSVRELPVETVAGYLCRHALLVNQRGLPITLGTVAVETRPVDPGLFSVPSGYTRVAESDMGLGDLSAADQEVLRAFEKQLTSQMPTE